MKNNVNTKLVLNPLEEDSDFAEKKEPEMESLQATLVRNGSDNYKRESSGSGIFNGNDAGLFDRGEEKSSRNKASAHFKTAKSVPKLNSSRLKKPQLEGVLKLLYLQDAFAVDYTRDRDKFDKKKKMLKNLGKDNIIL
ncbi:hypothetical protein RFI_29118 [Reticulomyxa filosa]|uniref:Uncharacterized protein n=1 Tax=Reticulomyxa filosa TaxID=46433 RepID=X6M5G4_RETFI|nr:hypothetical protein RFI_29118 [Reticulomyxa filosa]|eukprot:ETO08270.1 hypothetical protein RFI_29118 [Reticulomyxa filosa]